MKKKSKNKLNYTWLLSIFLAVSLLIVCKKKEIFDQNDIIKPIVVTEKTKHDTDDPAIWINPIDPTKSLIIGTDKNEDGALYVYDLNGKIDEEKTIRNLKRPNNVDVEYGLVLNGEPVDIAVTTERFTSKLRIYKLPEMKAIDNGGIE